MKRNKLLCKLAGLSVFVVVGLSGCLVPEGRKVVSGHEYSREAISFLDLPGASREETVSTLGPPSWESKDSRVMLYLWESTFKWLFVPPDDWKEWGIHQSRSEIRDQRWALFISYDEQGRITGHAAQQIGKNLPLEEACLQWSRRLRQ